MMRDSNENNITDAVLETIKSDNPRLQEIMSSLIKHLHSFIREVEPTEEEWLQGIQFLTDVGQLCDDVRQEFILLSDTLGVSILVDAINHRQPEGVTQTTVLGPFHVQNAPIMEHGSLIASEATFQQGNPTVVRGQITDPDGKPIAGAKVDVWQASGEGQYDVQMPGAKTDLRGIFETDDAGRFWFRTIKPSAYPIPNDGPVGVLLRSTGRHPYRPAHVHYMIEAEGYETLITHVFVAGDEYLNSDAVFAVKDSLIAEFIKNDDVNAARQYAFDTPFYELDFNFRLKPASQA
jgi:catechol 1,2-dioxygenase